MTTTYTSYLTFNRTYGKPLAPVDTSTIDPTSSIAQEEAYFRANIFKVSSGAELAADERLWNYALTAFGLEDQINNKDFVIKVLDEGVFDPFVPFTDDQIASQSGLTTINSLAATFWFSETYPLDVILDEAIFEAVNTVINEYAFRADGVLEASFAEGEIEYFAANAGLQFTAEQLTSDSRLYDFIIRAFGLEAEFGNKELITKALAAGVYNPSAGVLKPTSAANTSQDSRFETLARAFAFNEIGDQNIRNSAFINTVVERYNTEVLETQAKEERDDTLRGVAFSAEDQREIEYFRENIGKVQNEDDLIADYRLYRFVLRAYDLESQIDSQGLIRKVLQEGVVDEESLANQLIDEKYRILAGDLRFAEDGTKNVRNPNFASDVIERFERVTAETNAGVDNVGVRLAAYFERQAPNIDNWLDVLGDSALREVVFTAFDFADEMGTLAPERLVKLFEARYDIEDLQKPEQLEKFINRFAVLYDVKNGAPSSSGGSSLLSLYGVGGSAGGSGDVAIDSATLGATNLF
ncbi:MAG: DUF1217 domain-containing protein [Pseudomonadota bacterium]